MDNNGKLIKIGLLLNKTKIAAKWMGHSIDVHVRHYQKYIDEIAMAKIWERLNLG